MLADSCPFPEVCPCGSSALLSRPSPSALVASGSARAAGLLIPEDKKLPPLAMLNHKVTVTIDDQVAITTVEQTFRNHTDRNLEATYLFPVPKGASVDKFTMWVDGKEAGGELLEAKKARQVYTDIVRRTQDPGLLEYIGNNLMRLRVFPIPPKGDQKVKISFKSIAPKDGASSSTSTRSRPTARRPRTLEEFSVKVTHQVAARRSRTSTARRTPSRSTARATSEVDRRVRAEPGACSTRTSSSSTASATRTSA